MSELPAIPISLPALGEAELQAVRECLESGWLVQGPRVKAFETAFAARHRAAHAVAVSSCTAALHLALEALGVGPGDEVIVPAFTWVATANAVIHAGATPVFVDVREDSYNLDPFLLAAALTPRTRAVIPVHLFGLCADLDALAAKLPPQVAVIEDAACAAGAALRGRPAGTMGRVGCFSFHPRKSITTGEGGMLTTADAALARRLRSLRNHGIEEAEPGAPPLPAGTLADVILPGFNYRMTDLQAALGLAQLGRLDGFIAERDRWARWYATELDGLGWLSPPAVPEGFVHAWQAYVTCVGADAPLSRDALMAALARRGVATRPGTHAVPELRWYRERFGLRSGQFPVAARLARQSLALPLHNRMNAADYARVVQALRAG
jgi:dTDP-4-amino-4,6-dideoxygalactose transaminase